ncbi:MAG TPA: molybdate ABC transporter substrate-binding protein, partial [Smithellaceae bacterium]|nr:molybdate ABC transporter substrate-binding protein [Smithellaceae bacterium]
PDLLQMEGITEGAFIYARGQTILWSVHKDFCKASTWQDALTSGNIKKVAVADPFSEPYGMSAKTALQKTGLWGALKEKLVNGGDVSLSFQYASTQAVDAAFCAFAAASSPQGRAGCYYEIKEAPAVVQAGCILKNARNKICAELFTAYMMSGQTAPVKMKYGYR